MSLLYQADLDRQHAGEFRDLAYRLLKEADLQAKAIGARDELVQRQRYLAQNLGSLADEAEQKVNRAQKRGEELRHEYPPDVVEVGPPLNE